MPKPKHIELPNGITIPIIYEDSAVMAIDKPEGWLLAPDDWDRTGRNLQLAIESSMNAPDFWARSRNLRFLRYVHRLDGDTTGLLLMAKSPGAVRAFGELFENQRVKKGYLAVVRGVPRQQEWTCRLPLGEHPYRPGLMVVDQLAGKEAETHFRVIQAGTKSALVLVEPRTGRTHQIRVHLAESEHPVLNDPLYAGEGTPERRDQREPLALRAFRLSYVDPFRQRPIHIQAPVTQFLQHFGFPDADALLRPVRAVVKDAEQPGAGDKPAGKPGQNPKPAPQAPPKPPGTASPQRAQRAQGDAARER